MPLSLSFTQTSNPNMMASPLRSNFRRAASHTLDRGLKSPNSSHLNCTHSIFSPPPSPGLPSSSQSARKSKKGFSRVTRPRRFIHLLFRLVCLAAVAYVTARLLLQNVAAPLLGRSLTSPGQYEMAGKDDLPDFPTPIVVTDDRGRAKWTVSIPPTLDFPLTLGQYRDICEKCSEVSVRESNWGPKSYAQSYLGRGMSSQPRFVDVHEAEATGLLPGPASKSRRAKMTGQPVLVNEERGSVERPVCRSSLTFMLESTDAGMGKALLMLWTAYGLAKREGRAFFIDDSRWAYGNYTEIFQTPPAPTCRSPPRHEMLPCPRHARHLVASAATASDVFGSLVSELDDGLPPDRSSQQTMFALARDGYEALFRLNKDDAEYVDTRVRELLAKRIVPRSKARRTGLAVGVHVRRGDRHPLEFQYRHSYVPVNTYGERVGAMLESRLGGDELAKQHSLVILASDDPMVYESYDLRDATPAQERIRLASKQAIQAAQPDRHLMHKMVDDAFGWEGGFFAAMFWNLGGKRTQTGPGAPVNEETLRLRSLVGRAYLMDLAVLADASDVVVCTVSAAGCRLLAVMMGWESAVEAGNWVNVDGAYGWRGIT